MKYLYYLYQLIIVAPIAIVLTLLMALFTILGCALLDASFWSYYPGKIWARAMVRLLLMPVHIEGREHMNPKDSYIIIPNHQGTFDIFLIYGFLNRHFKWMLKAELRSMPVIGRACESAGFIFVDQKAGPKKMRQTHDRAREILQDGISLVVFPEGARTWDGRLRKFKRGAFQLADELQLPLLPITINGSFEALPRKRGYVNFVHWHPLKLIIHPPLYTRGEGGDAEREVMQEAYEIIESRLETKPVPMKEGTYNPED